MCCTEELGVTTVFAAKSMLETRQNLLAIKMTSEFFLSDSYILLLDTYSARPNLVILGVVVNSDTTVL